MPTIDIILQHQVLFVSICSLFSLLVGSFLNVVIYRLPIIMENAWRSEIEQFQQGDNSITEPTTTAASNAETFNLLTPRSRCPQCNTAISALQNIPIISYLFLAGKCKHCKTPISARYPLVEAITATLSGVIAWHFFAEPVTAIAAIILTWCLIALTGIDYDTYLLPDSITLPLVWAGLIINYFGLVTSFESAFWGAIAGYMTLWLIYWGFKLLTGKEGMGYGDFKLLAALGAWLGWQLLPVIIILSSLVGAVIGISLIIFSGHEKQKPIPFGPYLAIAGWIALVWGEQINSAYMRYMGL
jgi:leader peptidase (prepilin peptidase)/N-methyltransferase